MQKYTGRFTPMHHPVRLALCVQLAALIILANVGSESYVAAASSSTAFTIRKVALTGEPAPGLPGETFTSFYHPPVISDGGVAFVGGVTGNLGVGIWVDRGEGLELALRSGQTIPGFPGTLVIDSNVRINDAAQLALRPRFSGAGHGILLVHPDGAIDVPAYTGHIAPGVEPNAFYSPKFPDLADNGQVAFGSMYRSDSDHGIWATGYASGSAPQLIVLRGMAAPGTPYSFERVGGVVVGGGTIVFAASVEGPDFFYDNQSIWQYDASGVMRAIALQGQKSPNGRIYNGFASLIVNERGHVAIMSDLGGIVKTTEAGPEVVAWEGDVPLEMPGSRFWLFDPPALNDLDQVAFHGYTFMSGDLSTESSGVWSEGLTDMLHLVARGGMPAPGTSGSFSGFGNPVISNAGYTAFTAGLQERNASGLWVETAPGVLQLIAVEGNAFCVGPGDMRVIKDLTFVGSTSELSRHKQAINGRGELVFALHFTDGSAGIFTANIPEPSCCLLMAVSVAVVFGMRVKTRVMKSQMGRAMELRTNPRTSKMIAMPAC